AAGAPHPQLALASFQNRPHACARESVFLRERCEFAIRKTIDSAIQGSKPHSSGAVFINRQDGVASQAVFAAKVSDWAHSQAIDSTLIGAQPNIPAPVDIGRTYVIAGESVFRPERQEFSLRKPAYTPVRANPKRSGLVARDGKYGVVRETVGLAKDTEF